MIAFNNSSLKTELTLMFMKHTTTYRPLKRSDAINLPHEHCNILHEVSDVIKAGHSGLSVTHENTPPVFRVRTEKLSQVQKSDTTLARLL